MKHAITRISILLMVIAFGNLPLQAMAQKLPKIQQTPKRAPADIKIDGHCSEWNNKFEAKNVSNRIYYTISNDDNNLYLTVLAADVFASEKSIFGIGLLIDLPIEKGIDPKKSIMVTFPSTIEVQKHDALRYTLTRIQRLQQRDTTKRGKLKMDSLRTAVNKMMNTFHKEIGVAGIKEIPTPSISIYNTEGINVAALVNENMRFTYELSIPLKFLGAAINNGKNFSYKIKMNGVPLKSVGSPFPRPTIIGNVVDAMGVDNAYVTYPTDLSGTYTLAKK